jgi:hypothetical protein
MTKHDWIYIGLLAFTSLGFLIDSAVWPVGPPRSFTISDLMQMMVEIEDATRMDLRRSPVARTMTILLAPVGLAIYLYQTRPLKEATVSPVAFAVGLIVVAILAMLLGGWLVTQGVLLLPSFSAP